METIIFVLALAVLFFLIGLVFYAGFSGFKFVMFYFDRFSVFVLTWYNVHFKFSLKISSGKAVYFWDILFSVLAVIIYSAIFNRLCRKFTILGKIFNFIISLIGTWFAYYTLASIFFPTATTYFIPLLNNQIANELLNYALLLIPTFIVFSKREEAIMEFFEGEGSSDIFD